MGAIEIIADCLAAGVRLEPRAGGRLGIVGERVAIDALRDRIVEHKSQLLRLLGAGDGCARCGGTPRRASADGWAWCGRCDGRRHLLDLAHAAAYPALDLRPAPYVVRPGAVAWAEVARAARGDLLDVARARLVTSLGEQAAEVAPPESSLRPWSA